MYKDGAYDENRPQRGKKAFRSVRRSIRGYFIIICLLFTVVIVLCINNLITYRTLRQTQEQYDITAIKMDIIEESSNSMSENIDLLTQANEQLRMENEKLVIQYEEITKQIEKTKRINKELHRKNSELNEDNVALQNSLKMAAAAGVKPQNYSKFGGISARSEVDRGSYIGRFIGTAYTPSKEECGNTKGITNSGKPIIPGVSIAIDNKYWPFGTIFYIKGLGYAVAMDTGSAIKGKYRFDFSVFDKNFARIIGLRKWDVYLVKLGDGNVDRIEL